MAHKKSDPIVLRLHGVRGSRPATGSAFSRFGGDTICFEVEVANRRILIDAGTGLANVDYSGQRDIHVLLSHLHFDHIAGIFSFEPLFNPEVNITFWCGNLGGSTPENALRTLFARPYFPVPLDQCEANLALSVSRLAIRSMSPVCR